MPNLKHTQGPWILTREPDEYDDARNINAPSGCIGSLFQSTTRPADERNANAKLMAAAPELLDILLKVEPALIRLMRYEEGYSGQTALLVDQLRKVAAKAITSVAEDKGETKEAQ